MSKQPNSNHSAASREDSSSVEGDTDFDLDSFVICTPQFIGAARTLKRCYDNWRRSKEGTLVMLTGPSGAGKTTVADDFLRDIEDEWEGIVSAGEPHDEEEALESEEDDDAPEADEDLGPVGRLPRTAGVLLEGPNGVLRPVIKVFVEPKARARVLLRDIVRALGIKPKATATFGELMEILDVQLAQQQVRMVMLDEVHHIVERQGSQTAYEGSEVVKMLLVQARMQVVCIGLEHAETIIDNNKELPRHVRKRAKMRAMALDFAQQSEYLTFLDALEDKLPLPARPAFSEPNLALRLHIASEGLIGLLTNLVHAAVDIALGEDASALGMHHLAEAFADIEGLEYPEHVSAKRGPKNAAKDYSENPFLIGSISEESFKPIRERIRKRRAQLKAQAARYGKNAPDLTRS